MLPSKEIVIAQLESTEEFPILLSEVWEWLGYSKKENALQSFRSLGMAESTDFIQLLIRQELKIKPLTEIKMTIDAFKMWAMGTRTERGNEVRRYYLRVEKEWKADRANYIPEAFQVEAHLFRRQVFSPWRDINPAAAIELLRWEGVEARQQVTPAAVPAPQRIEASESQSPANVDWLKLVDSLGKAANRAGLAGNKSLKEAQFLAEQLEKVRKELFRLEAENEELKAAGPTMEPIEEVEKLRSALWASQAEVAQLNTRLGMAEDEIARLERKLKKDAPPAPKSSRLIPNSVLAQDKRAIAAKMAAEALPPSPKGGALVREHNGH